MDGGGWMDGGVVLNERMENDEKRVGQEGRDDQVDEIFEFKWCICRQHEPHAQRVTIASETRSISLSCSL